MKLASILSPFAVALVAASSLFGGAAAFHNFSPICTTGVTDMQQSIHSAGPDATMANWKITVAKGTTAGQFVVTAAGTPMTYGLVLRVQDAKTKNPTGAFVGTVPPTLKVAAVGDGTSCGPSVVTHIDNPASTSIALTWDSQKFVGNVNISAIVISSAGTTWTVIGTNVQVNADGSFVAAGAAAPPAAVVLQGIMQYRVYIIAAGCALGILAIAMIVRIAIKRQQNSSKV